MREELPGQMALFTVDGMEPEYRAYYEDESCVGMPNCPTCQAAIMALAQNIAARNRRIRREKENEALAQGNIL
jgi:hypothetical protein